MGVIDQEVWMSPVGLGGQKISIIGFTVRILVKILLNIIFPARSKTTFSKCFRWSKLPTKGYN